VTLFAAADSYRWRRPVCFGDTRTGRWSEVWECLHIAHLMEQADRFDLIHNHFDFLP
jgi:hypothetical protein